MNYNTKYFIDILASHINSVNPPVANDLDWQLVYDLSVLHNVTGMVALQIKKLPANLKPQKELLSKFNQSLGYTIQNYELKVKGYEVLVDTLTKNKVPHLVLKGAILRDLYPVKEVRTSGDTDIVTADLQKCTDLLLPQGFKASQLDMVQHELSYNGQVFEIKNYIDHVMNLSDNVFTSLFDKNECYTENGYTYFLTPDYHLAYIIAHLLSHIKEGGAGIRQLMDIHMMFTSYQIDLNKVFDICKEVECLKASKCLLALTKEFFNTPIDFEYKIDDNTHNLLVETIFNGGVFGFGNGDKGTERLIKTMKKTQKNSTSSSVKALLSVFVIDRYHLYNVYKYSAKCHLLLPVAYFHRLFTALFKRRKSSIKKVKSIFTTRDTAYNIGRLINNLEDK